MGNGDARMFVPGGFFYQDGSFRLAGFHPNSSILYKEKVGA